MRTNSKGYRLATTVQGPATGKGAHFIIVDDPFKAAEAASESTRNAVYDWFKGSLMTRFDKPAEGAMVVVQQRLHQDDLIGRLRDEGGWEYLEMPGECVERQDFDLGDGETWEFRPGDLLFEERFNQAALCGRFGRPEQSPGPLLFVQCDKTGPRHDRLKYKAALSVAYGAGLRVSEVANLKVSDIDSQRMTLRVEQGRPRPWPRVR